MLLLFRKRVQAQPVRRSLRQKGIKAEPVYLPDDFREPSKESLNRANYTSYNETHDIQGNVEVDEDGKAFLEALQKSLSTEKPFSSADGLVKQEPEVKDHDKSTYDDLLDYANMLSKLDVQEDGYMKVTSSRAYSLDVSPETSSILVGTGDKSGMLGLWRYTVDSGLKEEEEKTNVYQLNIHSDSISSLYFDRTDYSKIFSTSYDGRAMIFDANKMVFEEYYQCDQLLFDVAYVSPNAGIASSDAVLLGRGDGMCVLYDTRHKKQISSHRFHDGKINSIETCPAALNYLVTASLDRTVGVWDIRNLEKEVATIGHNLAVSHAAFSPDGTSICSVCNDDYLHLFDFSKREIVDDKAEYAAFRHCNRTGRWLTRFKVNFDKKCPNSFVVGSMDKPRCIEVFRADQQKGTCKRAMRLRSEQVASVQSLNVFHDSMNVIAGTNSSGRISVWH